MIPIVAVPGALDAPAARAAPAIPDAVLAEIGTLLARLACDPTHVGAIDLGSLPLDACQRARLRERLGRGEVIAVVDAAGRSEVAETAYAGVWWVRHEQDAHDTALEQIVVARVPALLSAHPADIERAARLLAHELALVSGADAAQQDLEATDG